MAEDKIYLPQTGGGLIRYFDATKESIKFKPEHIAGICAGIVILEIAIKLVF